MFTKKTAYASFSVIDKNNFQYISVDIVFVWLRYTVTIKQTFLFILEKNCWCFEFKQENCKYTLSNENFLSVLLLKEKNN